jgi:histone H3/H4
MKRRHGRGKLNQRENIGKSGIARIAYRAGVKSIATNVYDQARLIVDQYLDRVLKDAICFADYSGRVTVGEVDVNRALRNQNQTLYGFGSYGMQS